MGWLLDAVCAVDAVLLRVYVAENLTLCTPHTTTLHHNTLTLFSTPPLILSLCSSLHLLLLRFACICRFARISSDTLLCIELLNVHARVQPTLSPAFTHT